MATGVPSPWQNEEWLKKGGVSRVCLPHRCKADRERCQHEREPWFRRLLRFRAGAEGRILLQSKFGLGRGLMGGSGSMAQLGRLFFVTCEGIVEAR